MNPFTQACNPDQRLSKQTLLSLLESQIDTSKAIILSSGEIIDLKNTSSTVIHTNINNGTWIYYENLQPRRMFLINPNWEIRSFNSLTRMACVRIFTPYGMTNITLSLGVKQ